MPPDPDEGFLNDISCIVFIADDAESERESITLVRFHQLPKRPDVPLLAPAMTCSSSEAGGLSI